MIKGFFMAWGTFSASPCPHRVWDERCRNWMLVMYPFVGLLMGFLWMLLYWLLMKLELPAQLTGAIMTCYPFLVSGGIHLDGFMDVNDAISSRKDRAEKRRILKDSRVGAFAVISVSMMFMVFYAAMWSIVEWYKVGDGLVLALAMCVVREAAAFDVLGQRPMISSQYRELSGKSNRKFMFIGWLAMLVLVVSALLIGRLGGYLWNMQLLWSILIGYFMAQLVGIVCRRQLGGMNGDIAGTQVVWGELTTVVAMAILG